MKFFRSLALLASFVTLSASPIFAQTDTLNLLLRPVDVDGLPGLQSFAFGQHDGQWLVFGGRTDGLHRRQPFASFDVPGHNTAAIVIDPVAGQHWAVSLDSLSFAIADQLSSTNMEFYQEGDMLYLIGGYGYTETIGDHTTYGSMIAVNVPATMDAIINGQDISPYFRQVTDAQFAVTGGRLEKIGEVFYLVGGQKFLGRYNPMGPTHGPGFVQEYTNQVRRFTIQDDGTTLTVNHLSPWTDSLNLHRRDYNVLPQIMPDGQEGLTAFSGVFQPTVDLPFLNCVNIDSTGFAVNDSFTQHFNHYHCANLPLYDSVNQQMHSVFFGGIAQYYLEAGLLVQDDNVPFVKTIAQVTRDGSGRMSELALPIEMPDYLGASAEFIPNESLPRYANRVVKLHQLPGDTSLLGHIYGGIRSTDKNIFWINTGAESNATEAIYEVLVIREAAPNNTGIEGGSHGSNLNLRVNPAADRQSLEATFSLRSVSDVQIRVMDLNGQLVDEYFWQKLHPGEHHWTSDLVDHAPGMYVVMLQAGQQKTSRKFILGQ